MTDLRHATASGLRWLGLSGGLIAGVQLVQMMVLGRLLGPEPFGLFAVLLIVTHFANIVRDAGVPEYIVHKQRLPGPDLSALFWLNLAIGGSVAGLVWAIAPWLADAFDAPELVVPLHGICAAFLIAAVSAVSRATLQTALVFRPIAIADILAALINLSTSLAIALWIRADVWALVGGYLTGVTFRSLMLFLAARSHGFRPSLHNRWRRVVEFARFGSYRAGATMLNFFRSNIDKLVVGTLFGTQTLGFYTMASNLVMQPSRQINTLLSGVAFPVLSTLQHDPKKMNHGFLKLLRLSATLNAPLMLGAAAVAPVAVPLLLGPAWVPMIPLLMILALYATLRSLSHINSNLTLAYGKADWAFYWNAALLVIEPGVILAAGWLGSAITLATTLAVMQCALIGLNYRFLVRPLTGPIDRRFMAALTPLALAALMAVPVWLIGQHGFIHRSPTVTLGLQIWLGACLYLGAVALVQRDIFSDARAMWRRTSPP